MNELELIELIQSQLPADLTEEQLEKLRTVMRTSAPLRDAILDELRLEQGLATRLAPEGMQPDEWVDHISRVASARRRSKFIWINSIILVAALLIGGGVMLVSSIQVEKTPEVASNDNPGEGEVQPANREPDKTDKKDDKPDKARLNGGGDAALPDRPGQQPDLPNANDSVADADGPDFAPTWQVFDDPPANDDRRWMGRLGLTPAEDQRLFAAHESTDATRS